MGPIVGDRDSSPPQPEQQDGAIAPYFEFIRRPWREWKEPVVDMARLVAKELDNFYNKNYSDEARFMTALSGVIGFVAIGGGCALFGLIGAGPAATLGTPLAVVLGTAAGAAAGATGVTHLIGSGVAMLAAMTAGCFQAIPALISGGIATGRHIAQQLRRSAPALPAPEPRAVPPPAAAPATPPERLPKLQVTMPFDGGTIKGYGPDVEIVRDALAAVAEIMAPFEETAVGPGRREMKAVRRHLDRAAALSGRLHVVDDAGNRLDGVPFFHKVRNKDTGVLERYILLPAAAPIHAASMPVSDYARNVAEALGVAPDEEPPASTAPARKP